MRFFPTYGFHDVGAWEVPKKNVNFSQWSKDRTKDKEKNRNNLSLMKELAIMELCNYNIGGLIGSDAVITWDSNGMG